MNPLKWMAPGMVAVAAWLAFGSVERGIVGVSPAQAAGGCGVGFHRGPYGACRPNAYGGYYGRPGYYGGYGYRGGAVYGGRAVYGHRVYGGRVYGGRGYRAGGFHGGRAVGFHGGRGFRGGGRFHR
ncbi:UNVERIFIED_CONTAM: hypothetical protein Q9R58_05890 [Methylobacteriaceae bacterium AG10]|nr:hypothetical protein [Methylobacteriaceae bacterium AG10]